jgi:hypothetical protein
MTGQEQLPAPGFSLDPALVKRFVADKLDEDGQAELADQMARLAVFQAELPNPVAAKLTSVVEHLGGDSGLADWLDRFPGRPRITVRLFALIELLDRFSAEPAVITALSELRDGTPYPPGLERYISPDTNDETLGGLAWHIESLLAQDSVDDAVRLALDIVDMLTRIAPRATELDPAVSDLGGRVDEMRAEIVDVAGMR